MMMMMLEPSELTVRDGSRDKRRGQRGGECERERDYDDHMLEADSLTNKQNRQMNRQKGRETNKQTDRDRVTNSLER